MATDLVKRFIKKDGSQRISFYREEYADNPRDMTDEPLHCVDWSRDYSIMNKRERETKSENARDLIEYLLRNFGNETKIISLLVENGKHMIDANKTCDNALVYDRSAKRWALKEFIMWHGGQDFEWEDTAYFDCNRDNIDAREVLECVLDSTIDFFVKQNCLTDKVKVMSYGFGYYGGISFDHDFSTESEGICWLEKDEFLKYSGHNEEYWDGKTLDEIEWLLDELEAWGDNDVYGFVVENAVRIQGIKIYYNGEREDEPYIDTQWEESDFCWGFYGESDKREKDMFDEAGLDINDFEEENINSK